MNLNKQQLSFLRDSFKESISRIPLQKTTESKEKAVF